MVAWALRTSAGFGSVRRFNETFQTLFGCPPAKLRRAKTSDDAARIADAVTLRLAYRPPYDWNAILGFLAARAIPGVEVVTAGSYARTIELEGVFGSIHVAAGDGDFLKATIRFPRLALLPRILARIRRVFDLAADPLTIGAHLSEDPTLAALVAARPGLRVPGAWDGFELAVRAILGQQITVGAATQLAGKLANKFGEAFAGRDAEAGLTHVFPSAAVVATADLSVLRMPRVRIASLSSLAAAVAADPQFFGARRGLDEAIEQLTSLAGIGEWTAQYIAMRELREPDAFPASDIGLLRAMTNGSGARPSPAWLLARAEKWRPWRAYAALHLWASNKREIGLRHHGLPPEGSYLARLVARHGIDAAAAPVTGRSGKVYEAGVLEETGLRTARVVADVGGRAQALTLAAHRSLGAAIDLVDVDAKGRFSGDPASGWIAPYVAFLVRNGVPATAIRIVRSAQDLRPCDLVAALSPSGDATQIGHIDPILNAGLAPGGRLILDIRQGSGAVAHLTPWGRLTELSVQIRDGAPVTRVMLTRADPVG